MAHILGIIVFANAALHAAYAVGAGKQSRVLGHIQAATVTTLAITVIV